MSGSPNITMPSKETPTGPMTRTRAKAIHGKVTLFLNELPLDMHENSLLPKVWTLYELRCEGMEHKEGERMSHEEEGIT